MSPVFSFCRLEPGAALPFYFLLSSTPFLNSPGSQPPPYYGCFMSSFVAWVVLRVTWAGALSGGHLPTTSKTTQPPTQPKKTAPPSSIKKPLPTPTPHHPPPPLPPPHLPTPPPPHQPPPPPTCAVVGHSLDRRLCPNGFPSRPSLSRP